MSVCLASSFCLCTTHFDILCFLFLYFPSTFTQKHTNPHKNPQQTGLTESSGGLCIFFHSTDGPFTCRNLWKRFLKPSKSLRETWKTKKKKALFEPLLIPERRAKICQVRSSLASHSSYSLVQKVEKCANCFSGCTDCLPGFSKWGQLNKLQEKMCSFNSGVFEKHFHFS